MPLAGITSTGKDSVNSDNVKMDAEDTREHSGATEVQIFCRNNDSKVPLDANGSDSRDSNNCIVNLDLKEEKDVQELPSCSQTICGNVTSEIVKGESESTEDERNDEYFSAKDLLRFAWQIARGMASVFSLFESCFRLVLMCICHANKETLYFAQQIARGMACGFLLFEGHSMHRYYH